MFRAGGDAVIPAAQWPTAKDGLETDLVQMLKDQASNVRKTGNIDAIYFPRFCVFFVHCRIRFCQVESKTTSAAVSMGSGHVCRACARTRPPNVRKESMNPTESLCMYYTCILWDCIAKK